MHPEPVQATHPPTNRRNCCLTQGSALTRITPNNTINAPTTKFALSGSSSSKTPKVTPNNGVMKENTARFDARYLRSNQNQVR